MKYACLIYSVESDPIAHPDPTTEAFAPIMAGYMAFGEEFGPKIVAGEALEPVATATCVRVRDGDTITTDGPFAETKEQLGGFYLIEAGDLDEAIAIAAKIPHASMGTIEVRPVPNFG
ncbi:YciI family protein [Ilumatobacter sp.]|uniref:YciI family protein n=1 Tax=Ilumatobacter sp. TaxID=1967498 RepID=UPI003C58BB65